ncbi:MAG: family 16 glycosylhydrolase [Bacillota bacterium]
MVLRKNKIIFFTVLSLIMLLTVVGCKGEEMSEGKATLVVNMLDDESELEKPEITVLQDGEEIEKQEGQKGKFDLEKGIYKVKVSDEKQESKSYDVYLSDSTTLDAKLAGEGNLIKNGAFNKELSNNEPNDQGVVNTEDSWIFHLNSGGEGNASINDGIGNFRVTNAGQAPHSVQLMQAPVNLEKGKRYKISYDIKSLDGNAINLKMGSDGERGWETYFNKEMDLSGNWEKHESEFTMLQDTNDKARFEMCLLDDGLYQIDNIRVVKVEDSEMAKEGDKTEADENEVEDWELVWSDDFDKLDKDIWNLEVGNGHEQGIPGWGNNELQYYTDGDNVKVEDSKLIITAREEEKSDSHGNYDYTSARLNTKGNYDFKYGRVEIKAKMPEGQGLLPALWTLGSDIDENPWPDCGEIDIAEVVGDDPDTVHGTVHGPISGHTGVGAGYTLPDEEKFSDGFHEYAIEWDKNEVEFYVDDKLYHIVNKDEVGEEEWVYDKPQFFIMNLAVGGNWPGKPDENTEFPKTMEVDHIKVYEDQNPDSIDEEEKWDSELEEKWKERKKK